jgi:hypothetical protein
MGTDTLTGQASFDASHPLELADQGCFFVAGRYAGARGDTMVGQMRESMGSERYTDRLCPSEGQNENTSRSLAASS